MDLWTAKVRRPHQKVAPTSTKPGDGSVFLEQNASFTTPEFFHIGTCQVREQRRNREDGAFFKLPSSLKPHQPPTQNPYGRGFVAVRLAWKENIEHPL